MIGYFIGVYIDRAVKGLSISFITAGWQGALQAGAMLIALLAAPPPNLKDSPNLILFAAVTTLISALSGFLIGLLFQYFYGRAEAGAVSAISAPQTARVG